MTKHNYEMMCYNILYNKDWYQQISPLQIPTFKTQYLAIINEGYQKGLIDQ